MSASSCCLGSQVIPLPDILDKTPWPEPPYRPHADPRQDRDVITDARFLLGDFVAVAHCKDIADPAPSAQHNRHALYDHVAAGTGVLDYHHYLSELGRLTSGDVPLSLHGLTEKQIPTSLAFVRERLNEVDNSSDRYRGLKHPAANDLVFYLQRCGGQLTH